MPATVVVDLRILGAPSDLGRVAYAVIGDREAFERDGEPIAGGFLPVVGGEASVTLELAEGEYAVRAFHDADDDGSLDRGAFGAPTEAYGFSNDARGAFGPPSWSEAKVRIEGARVTLAIRMR
jgi:uncharacterized protein (DUF2141 family)